MEITKIKKKDAELELKSKATLVKFDDFQSLANTFYQTLGRRPYDILGFSQQKLLREHLIFYGGFFNMNLVVVLAVVLLILSFIQGASFIETVKNLISIAFFFVTDIKLLVTIINRAEINDLMRKLHEIFPKSLEDQEKYETKRYLKFVRRNTTIFSVAYLFIACTFVFYPLGLYLVYDCLLQRKKYGLELMFPMYVPWNTDNYLSYGTLFIWQLCSSHTGAVGQIAVDLLFYSAATQLIMHYDYVARSIENYKVKANENDKRSKEGVEEDMKFICEMIGYHKKILGLSGILNKAFGISLLVNFICSCGTICFCAFFATVDVDVEIRIKWAIITLGIVLQVYYITYYGQLLIDASTGISSATFRQNWPCADVRYQKMLTLIMIRAQKPAYLTATSYVRVSQSTMTVIVQVTYKFLCVLQNIYSGKKT